MDSEKVKKKFFDITPPPAGSSVPTAPTVSKHQMIAINESPKSTEDPLLSSDHGVAVTQKAQTIEPLVEKTPDTNKAEEKIVELTEAPIVTPLAELPKDVDAIEQPEADDTYTASSDTVVNETYAVTDALPDPSEKSAKDIKDTMQEPKIYDTTAYHIPIKNSDHSHGGTKMALVFGAIFAMVVVGGVVFAMVKLGS